MQKFLKFNQVKSALGHRADIGIIFSIKVFLQVFLVISYSAEQYSWNLQLLL